MPLGEREMSRVGGCTERGHGNDDDVRLPMTSHHASWTIPSRYDDCPKSKTLGAPMATGYKKQDIEFVPSLQLFAQGRASSPLTVLAGANNSGKSLTLRWLKST
jgi:hypothetical protein